MTIDAARISVIIIDLYGDLGTSVRALAAQTRTDEIELVVITPDGDPAPVRARYPELERFRECRFAAAGAIASGAALLAIGMRAARAPVVAYCEDHVFPEADWVAARLAAHDAGATVVGSVLRNANPESPVSWAVLLHDFGPFVAPVAGGPAHELPWHQCSYLRDALPLGPELPKLLENEGLLHADLRKAGHELVLESACVARHLNPSRWTSLVSASWQGGLIWGAGRASHERWSVRRRAYQLLLTPHTIARQLRSRLADLRRVVPERRRSILPGLALSITVHAVGEAVGLLIGAGDAELRRTDIELNRRSHLRTSELRSLS